VAGSAAFRRWWRRFWWALWYASAPQGIADIHGKIESVNLGLVATQDAVVAALVELARADNHGAVQNAVNVFREECSK